MILRNPVVNISLGVLSLALVYVAVNYNSPSWAGARIADKNAEARGGLKAWENIQSMTLTGKLDAGKVKTEPVKVNADPREARAYAREAALKILKREPSEALKTVQLPYKLDLQRPRKSHLEIEFNGDKALQVFDGEHGWKVRPFLNRKVVETYTAEETKAASAVQDLDGFLIDHSAKGTKVELEGHDSVEGHDAIKLKLTLKNGQNRYVWVDAKTFLEVKMVETRKVNGKEHSLTTFFRDYKPVNGVMIAHIIENQSGKDAQSAEKIVIDKVTLNPKLDNSLFSKPSLDAKQL